METKLNSKLGEFAVECVREYPLKYKYMVEDEHVGVGGSEMIVNLSYLTNITMQDELKNIFTENEALMICDMLNGTLILSSSSIKNQLLLSVTDAVEEFRYDIKWEIDGQVLCDKIRKLTEFQCYCVTIMVNAFWREDFTNDVKRIFSID